jgi:UvrD-like helicase family protein
MSQQTRPSPQKPIGVRLASLWDRPDLGRASASPENALIPVRLPDDRSRLDVVLVLVGIGLLMQGAADALARNGHTSPALPLFLIGIALDFGACAWRLTSSHATREERVWVSVVLGLSLLASYVMLEPLQLDTFDELDHVGTLVRLLDSRTLFPSNPVLPVSPYYPGLELATVATKWLTGLPLVMDELIVLAVVRVVIVLGIFLVVERVCHSPRAGGIGVLVYAASPQFYGFDAQYAYETIGLAFAVGAVYLLFFSVDAARPKMGRAFVLALGSVGAVVISHHVTGWLTIVFLVVWAVGLYLTSHPLRHVTIPSWRPWRASADSTDVPTDVPTDVSADASAEPVALEAPPSPEPNGSQAATTAREGFWRLRSTQARVIGVATLLGLAAGGAWTLYVGHILAPYLGPIFSDAAAEIRTALGNGRGDRTLFKSSSGGASPHWEIALILGSAAAWCLVLLPSLYSVVFKRSVRGGALRYIPAVIAATYPLSVLANVSSGSKLVAERATTFIFFGVAVVVGAWLAKRIARERRITERLGTIGVATLVFVGSLLFGIGPLVSLLPGPYQVGGDNLSYGSPSFALARWADTHLPAGSHVAADKDNGVLLNALGGVDSVTAEAGLVNPELLYFDDRLSIYDIYLIRKADIRYLVVDQRLAQSPPLYGTYIADGEPPKRLTLPELTKFDTYPFIKRIYDNGAIQVYDLTPLLNPSQRAAPAGAPVGGSGLNVGVFVLAAAVAALWALRLRRRRAKVHDGAHLVVCGLVAALVLGVFGAFLIRWTHAPPEIVAIVVLLVLLGLSLRPPGWRLRPWAGVGQGPAGPAGSADPDEPEGRGPATNGERGLGRDGITPSAVSVPMQASAPTGPSSDSVVVGLTFYERREIKDVLAYLRVLADPDDDGALRRVANIPKRGLGPRSVSRLADWARKNDVSLDEAIDRADEAGLRGKALQGALGLSDLLAELRQLADETNPGDLVELVTERTGYMARLVNEQSSEAAGRIENVTELAARARAFDSLAAFLEAAALAEEDGREPMATPTLSASGATVPESAVTSGVPAAGWTRTRRSRVLLGALGVALFALGAGLATGAALKDWTPPPELSIATSTADRSVAQVQLGSAGPIAASLDVANGGRTLWRSTLDRTTAAQNVDIPSRYLKKGSRVELVTDGHMLRWVDGWVARVPELRPTGKRSAGARL